MHRRQRRLLIAFQELADAYDYVQRGSQIMADPFQEVCLTMVAYCLVVSTQVLG